MIDALEAIRTNHPARPFLMAGVAAAAYGAFRGGWRGLIWLGAGVAAFQLGFLEIERIRRLHGGNSHGVNRPPFNRPADSITLK